MDQEHPFYTCLRFTFGWEGDFSDDAGDPGGKTRWGITEAVARGFGFKGEMATLPKETAMEIYWKQYWTPLSLNEVQDIGIQKRLFDIAVNMGVGVAGKMIQTVLNRFNDRQKLWPDVQVDGHVGGATLAAIRSAVEQNCIRYIYVGIDTARSDFYIERIAKAEDDTNEKFLKGWINRVIPLLKEDMKLF